MPPGHRIRLPKIVFPPLETPAGAPGVGFLVAYEDAAGEEGWSTGIVRAIDEGFEGREFTVEARSGTFHVGRGLIFYWWPPPGPPSGSRSAAPQFGQPPDW